MPPPKKKDDKVVAVHPRVMSLEQRREAFQKAKAEIKADDYQVLRSDDQETLVPYGFLTFDYILGLGGLGRRGRVIQIHGDEHSFKSTTTYCVGANYQRQTGEALAIYDFERTGTISYVKNCGIDTDMIIFKQPDSVEDSVKDTLTLMKQGVRFFIYDSIPRMKTKIDAKEILNGNAFKADIGTHARSMIKFYDLLLPYAAEYDCTFLMVNQTRSRIEEGNDAKNAAKYPTFHNLPYTLPGGKMCRFVPSVMIETKVARTFRSGGYKDDEFILEPGKNEGSFVATQIKARVLKNKVTGGGYRDGIFWGRPGHGIDENISIREYARAYGLIDYSGKKWFVGKSLDQALKVYDNKAEAVQDLVVNQNPELLSKLRDLIIEEAKVDADIRFAANIDDKTKAYLEGMEDVPGETDDIVSSKGFVIEEDIEV